MEVSNLVCFDPVPLMEWALISAPPVVGAIVGLMLVYRFANRRPKSKPRPSSEFYDIV